MIEVVIDHDSRGALRHLGAVEWANHIYQFNGTYNFQYYGLSNSYKWSFEDAEDALVFKLKFG